MNMVEFGYILAVGLILMVGSVRIYPIVRRLRANGPDGSAAMDVTTE